MTTSASVVRNREEKECIHGSLQVYIQVVSGFWSNICIQSSLRKNISRLSEPCEVYNAHHGFGSLATFASLAGVIAYDSIA